MGKPTGEELKQAEQSKKRATRAQKSNTQLFRERIMKTMPVEVSASLCKKQYAHMNKDKKQIVVPKREKKQKSTFLTKIVEHERKILQQLDKKNIKEFEQNMKKT